MKKWSNWTFSLGFIYINSNEFYIKWKNDQTERSFWGYINKILMNFI